MNVQLTTSVIDPSLRSIRNRGHGRQASTGSVIDPSLRSIRNGHGNIATTTAV